MPKQEVVFGKGQKLEVNVAMAPGPQKIEVDLGAPTITLIHKFDNPLIVEMQERPIKTISLKGGIMFIVQDNHPDVAYTLEGMVVVDEEGQIVPGATVTPKVISDNPDVVALTPDPADPAKGMAHFGAPGAANINVVGILADGTELPAPIGAQFTVTVGDPKAITGGTLKFEGLEEAPTPPLP